MVAINHWQQETVGALLVRAINAQNDALRKKSMLNYGICQKCKDFLKIQTEEVELDIVKDKRGKVKNKGPIAWSCPVAKDLVHKKELPPEGCYYQIEQLLFFNRS